MIKHIFSALALLLLSVASHAAPATMRLDYYHTGDAKQEIFSVDRIVVEPLPWPGDLSKAIDDTNLGKYFFEVRDQKTKRVLYSRGFASIYGEWETTEEAKSLSRTFSESLRFPTPDAPVDIVLKKREARNDWREIWSTAVDPSDMFVDRSRPVAPASLIPIQKMGDPATKVDLLLLGDGYTKAEAKKFEADARRLTAVLFSTSPFKEHASDFNVWGLCPAANETRSRLTTRLVLSVTCSRSTIARCAKSLSSRLTSSSRFSPTTAPMAAAEFSISIARSRLITLSQITFSCTSSAITSLVSPTNITHPPSPTRRLPNGSNPGSQTRPPCWIRPNLNGRTWSLPTLRYPRHGTKQTSKNTHSQSRNGAARFAKRSFLRM